MCFKRINAQNIWSIGSISIILVHTNKNPGIYVEVGRGIGPLSIEFRTLRDRSLGFLNYQKEDIC